MKTIVITLLLLSSTVLSYSADKLWRPNYPEDFPKKSLKSFIDEHGEPDERKHGTGAKYHKTFIIGYGELLYEPTTPPDLSEIEEVLFCSWKDAPRGVSRIWFRRIDGDWMSFWSSADIGIWCGTSATF